MSLIVLGNANAGFALEIPKLRKTAEGLDEVREVIRATNQHSFTQGALRSVLGIPGSFYIQESACIGCQFGLPIVEVISRGLASSKPVLFEATSYTDIVQGRALKVDWPPAASATGALVNAAAIIPRAGITARYISASEPEMDSVGLPLVPGITYGVPSYPVTITDEAAAVWWQPNGWYLAKRDAVPLAYTPYHFFTDYFVYQHNPTFGGS